MVDKHNNIFFHARWKKSSTSTNVQFFRRVLYDDKKKKKEEKPSKRKISRNFGKKYLGKNIFRLNFFFFWFKKLLDHHQQQSSLRRVKAFETLSELSRI